MKVCKALWMAGTAMLAGCGGELDGTYVGGTGFMTAAVMELSGSRALIETINTARREVIATSEFEAEVRSGKLLLSSGGKTFVYGLAADEESLDCLSDSCQGFGGLGKGGMPRAWQLYRPEGN
ncbi:hypothetical protein HP532_06220 [Pseudomonas sp. CrR25]|nr:hypothetical protein [Pseudomonas sp. CrR25]